MGLDPDVLTAGDIAWAETAGGRNADPDSLRSLLTSGGGTPAGGGLQQGTDGTVLLADLLSAFS